MRTAWCYRFVDDDIVMTPDTLLTFAAAAHVGMIYKLGITF
jgi:hypothetical protein